MRRDEVREGGREWKESNGERKKIRERMTGLLAFKKRVRL